MNKDNILPFAAIGAIIVFVALAFISACMIAFGHLPHPAMGIGAIIAGIASVILLIVVWKMDDVYDPYK